MKRFHANKGMSVEKGVVRYVVRTGNILNGKILEVHSHHAVWAVPQVSVEDFFENVSQAEYIDGLLRTEFFIEVQEEDLPYFDKPKGDWEFREPEVGDGVIFSLLNNSGHTDLGRHVIASNRNVKHFRNSELFQGHRWCHRCNPAAAKSDFLKLKAVCIELSKALPKIEKVSPCSPPRQVWDDRPPLGLTPGYIWAGKRLEAIDKAKGRYRAAGKVIPLNWKREEVLLNILCERK